jgi:hypothetical protein
MARVAMAAPIDARRRDGAPAPTTINVMTPSITIHVLHVDAQ